MKTTLLFLIRVYQFLLSPLLGTACRFTPTCSHYAAEAINTHGIVNGGALAVRRLCKCHPFHNPEFDPVPSVFLCLPRLRGRIDFVSEPLGSRYKILEGVILRKITPTGFPAFAHANTRKTTSPASGGGITPSTSAYV